MLFLLHHLKNNGKSFRDGPYSDSTSLANVRSIAFFRPFTEDGELGAQQTGNSLNF
jgi:hypothetical protein